MFAFALILTGFAIGLAMAVAGMWWSLRDVDLSPDEPRAFK